MSPHVILEVLFFPLAFLPEFVHLLVLGTLQPQVAFAEFENSL